MHVRTTTFFVDKLGSCDFELEDLKLSDKPKEVVKVVDSNWFSQVSWSAGRSVQRRMYLTGRPDSSRDDDRMPRSTSRFRTSHNNSIIMSRDRIECQAE
jgi:hypothetical protein